MNDKPSAASQFQALIEAEWEWRMQADPLFATSTGDHRYDDRLPRVREADYAERLAVLRKFRARLAAIHRPTLPAAQQLNYDIFGRLLDNEIGEHEFGAHYLPLSKAGGFHLYFPDLALFTPFDNTQDYERYIARLYAFGEYAADHIELMRAGLRQGYRPARVTLDGVDASVRGQIVTTAPDSPLYAPFRQFPPAVAAADRQRLTEAGARAIVDSVAAGYAALLRFLVDEYLPAAREDVAAADLPRGAEFYRHRVLYYTSLELTPEAVHATGQAEVARIRAEMDTLIRRTGFTGSFAEFLAFLRTDDRFYVTSGEALLKETALVLKRMDGELPRLFGVLPRLPYGIRAIPDFSAPGNTTAYYYPAPGDGSRAGVYYVNTYDLRSRPLYEIEALSLHEAVPGHHLQIALQQELDLPHFRRFNGFTAFVEGWALYAERLGLEAGFYTDPYSDFGRLSYEMWRACRLVVDTGMHALGWSRQRAIDFMAANTSSTPLNITNEIDRYIAWPGQALAYKIGELKILELRAEAERALGARFNLRAFHDLLLG
ncbi:MAG: DUF885 domain-containing protein, partial [Anaerolineales bacterium]